MDIARAQNYFVLIFTNLIHIKEKMHVPVTVRSLDYDFNKNIQIYSKIEHKN